MRCFTALELDFESPVVLIHGPNGSGKTTILEALHYACYLKSFKTHLPKELVQAKAEGFGIGLGILSEGFDTLHVNFLRNKKSIKLNEQPVASFKELYDTYKAVTITEDDLLMIQGAPSLRRSFIDHVVVLKDPSFALLSKKYRICLDNRNALLSSYKYDDESYRLWTDQLLKTSLQIQEARKQALAVLEKQTQKLMADLNQGSLSITYEYARPYSDLTDIACAEDLFIRYPSLKGHESTQRRTLFGAHLDDFVITFQDKSSRTYASRGQQKLIIFMLKLAQLVDMPGTALLVDDFLTDFDEARAEALLPLMTRLPSQLIITSPIETVIKEKIAPYSPHIIKIGV